MGDLIREAFAALKEWPLVQAAVATMVLVIAALLGGSALKKQLPPAPQPPPQPGSIPVQIESPWLVQHLVEMHLDIERIRTSIESIEAQLNTNAAGIAGITALLRRRANKQTKPKQN